jgi:hypothetical protein
MYHRHGKLFRHTRWYFSMTLVKWKLILDRLEMVLISMQERCTVCVEYTTGMEIFSGHQMLLLGGVNQLEDHFSLFRDSVNLNAR